MQAQKTASDLTNEEIIRRLKEQYKELQEELFVDLAWNDKDAASEVSKEMFQTAAALNDVERYQQVLKVKETKEHLEHAKEDVHTAEEWVKKAHQEAVEADKKAHTVDSMDEVFDEAKHQHDMEIAKLSREAEDFANDVLLDTQFEQLQAELEYDHMDELLRDLQANEKMLHRSLEKIEAEEYLMHHWYEVELPKHQHFLKAAKNTIRSGKLIDHDPTKGNVAF